ncbi:MAG: helix-turn-helix domain-containing protein [Candidatus Promineofilum sp.]|nr:helix-turn-helix domain-containing protein [Promineifilum sp.]MCW5862811.1 helix-turn-helix transcriptional regulator [Anaerolineae bacterium]
MSEVMVVSDSGRLQGLHPTAAAVYRFVLSFKRECGGDSPSRREIAERLDVPVSVVHHHLATLERAGLVTLPSARGARRIGIPGAVWTPPV